MSNTAKNLEFLTARELGQELNLNPQYVRDLARLGLIPGKKIGASWRFSLKEVDEQMKLNALKAVERSITFSTSNNE